LLVELKSVEDTSWLQLFIKNSRLRHFTATTRRWHPFSRSYGANVPSSWTYHHPSAWEYSSRPPVSVCGTDSIDMFLADFPGRRPGVLTSRSPLHPSL